MRAVTARFPTVSCRESTKPSNDPSPDPVDLVGERGCSEAPCALRAERPMRPGAPESATGTSGLERSCPDGSSCSEPAFSPERRSFTSPCSYIGPAPYHDCPCSLPRLAPPRPCLVGPEAVAGLPLPTCWRCAHALLAVDFSPGRRWAAPKAMSTSDCSWTQLRVTDGVWSPSPRGNPGAGWKRGHDVGAREG